MSHDKLSVILFQGWRASSGLRKVQKNVGVVVVRSFGRSKPRGLPRADPRAGPGILLLGEAFVQGWLPKDGMKMHEIWTTSVSGWLKKTICQWMTWTLLWIPARLDHLSGGPNRSWACDGAKCVSTATWPAWKTVACGSHLENWLFLMKLVVSKRIY